MFHISFSSIFITLHIFSTVSSFFFGGSGGGGCSCPTVNCPQIQCPMPQPCQSQSNYGSGGGGGGSYAEQTICIQCGGNNNNNNNNARNGGGDCNGANCGSANLPCCGNNNVNNNNNGCGGNGGNCDGGGGNNRNVNGGENCGNSRTNCGEGGGGVKPNSNECTINCDPPSSAGCGQTNSNPGPNCGNQQQKTGGSTGCTDNCGPKANPNGCGNNNNNNNNCNSNNNCNNNNCNPAPGPGSTPSVTSQPNYVQPQQSQVPPATNNNNYELPVVGQAFSSPVPYNLAPIQIPEPPQPMPQPQAQVQYPEQQSVAPLAPPPPPPVTESFNQPTTTSEFITESYETESNVGTQPEQTRGEGTTTSRDIGSGGSYKDNVVSEKPVQSLTLLGSKLVRATTVAIVRPTPSPTVTTKRSNSTRTLTTNGDLYDDGLPDIDEYYESTTVAASSGNSTKKFSGEKNDILSEDYSEDSFKKILGAPQTLEADITGDPKCSSETLRIIMQENTVSSPTISKQLIFSAGRLAFGQSIDVVCSKNKFSYTVVSSKIFCEASRGPVTCFAFLQP